MNTISHTTELLRRQHSYSPSAILANPDGLVQLIDTFFHLKLNNVDHHTNEVTPLPPTPAALASHLGFASRGIMMKAVDDPHHPEESRFLIASALTQIEAYLTENALIDRINVPMTKFTLSATLGVVEKKEVISQDDNKIQINILGVNTTTDVTTVEIDKI